VGYRPPAEPSGSGKHPSAESIFHPNCFLPAGRWIWKQEEIVSARTKVGLSTLSLRQEPRLPRFDSASPDPAYVPTVLIVDDIALNRRLLRGILKATPYRILEAKRPSMAFSQLETEKVDLIVVDLVLPEMSGMEFCQMVKSDRRTQLIPILMLTSIQGIENEVAGLESGADDFLLKPLRPALVRTRVGTMLRHKALVDSLEEAETILFALAQSVEHRDRYTGLHCERLASYSIELADALGLSTHEQLALFRPETCDAEWLQITLRTAHREEHLGVRTHNAETERKGEPDLGAFFQVGRQFQQASRN
jgi:DNA-binding response OmpR family regulator